MTLCFFFISFLLYFIEIKSINSKVSDVFTNNMLLQKYKIFAYLAWRCDHRFQKHVLFFSVFSVAFTPALPVTLYRQSVSRFCVYSV